MKLITVGASPDLLLEQREQLASTAAADWGATPEPSEMKALGDHVAELTPGKLFAAGTAAAAALALVAKRS